MTFLSFYLDRVRASNNTFTISWLKSLFVSGKVPGIENSESWEIFEND